MKLTSEVVPLGHWWIPVWLDQWDHRLYFFLISRLPPSFLEGLQSATESKAMGLGLLGLVILYAFVWKRPWKYQLIVGVGFMLGLDWLVDEWIKGFFGRVKPYLSLSFVPVHHVAFSFPSSHAVNFGFMASYLYNHTTVGRIWGVLAILVSLSRVLCGRHYPLDVLGGLMLGIGVGCILRLAYLYVVKKYFSP